MKQFIMNDSLNNDIHTYVYSTSKKAKGVVQIIHGASEHFARYGIFAEYLNQQGYHVVGHDILGHGLSTKTLDYVHFADKDGHRLAYGSVVLVKSWIQKEYPELPLYLLGHSMGSFLARKLLLDFPADYQKAIISGTAYPSKALLVSGRILTSLVRLFKGPKYVSRLIQNMSIDANPIQMKKDGIIDKLGEAWLTRDKKIQDYYKHSPMCGQPFTVQANLDMFKWIHDCNRTKRIKNGNHHQPIFFISGGHDPLSSYGKDIKRLVDKMQAYGYDHLQYKIYPEARHEVLNEINHLDVYKDVLAFLK